jgi:chemotaxis protein methyltransferase CheR
MTTNESSFFRDLKPFDQFRSFILPQLTKARAQRRAIRIWSAACSSGQEPYSLAMLLSEEKEKLAGWQIEIFATDISTEILAKAEQGVYSQFEVQRGLPIQLLVKYFRQEGERWRINPAMRGMVRYKCLNLLDDFSSYGPFDVIFCRNVLIYFEQATKTKVLDRLSRVLEPDGFLYLGGAETIIGITDKFQSASERGIYTPVLSATAMAKKLASR